MGPALRTIVVVHNRILRDGICAHLKDCAGIDVAIAIDSLAPLPELVSRLNPDLVLIDLEMPEGDAIEGIRRIEHIKRGTWIIGLAIDEGRDYVKFAIRAGASSIIPKDLVEKMLGPLVQAGPPARPSDYECPKVVELPPSVVPNP